MCTNQKNVLIDCLLCDLWCILMLKGMPGIGIVVVSEFLLASITFTRSLTTVSDSIMRFPFHLSVEPPL